MHLPSDATAPQLGHAAHLQAMGPTPARNLQACSNAPHHSGLDHKGHHPIFRAQQLPHSFRGPAGEISAGWQVADDVIQGLIQGHGHARRLVQGCQAGRTLQRLLQELHDTSSSSHGLREGLGDLGWCGCSACVVQGMA